MFYKPCRIDGLPPSRICSANRLWCSSILFCCLIWIAPRLFSFLSLLIFCFSFLSIFCPSICNVSTSGTLFCWGELTGGGRCSALKELPTSRYSSISGPTESLLKCFLNKSSLNEVSFPGTWLHVYGSSDEGSRRTRSGSMFMPNFSSEPSKFHNDFVCHEIYRTHVNVEQAFLYSVSSTLRALY